jgi:Uma2 family endonuclease
MTTTEPGLDYQQFQRIPRHDSRRFELIDGKVFTPPTPNTAHQRTVGKVLLALDRFVKHQSAGEVLVGPLDVVFSKWTALEPDLLFIRKERRSIVTDANVQGVPDLVIEILSPSNKEYDRDTKLRAYEKAGVPEIWYLDPEDRTAEIMNLGPDGRYALTAELSGKEAIISKVLPDLSLTLDQVFRS